MVRRWKRCGLIRLTSHTSAHATHRSLLVGMPKRSIGQRQMPIFTQRSATLSDQHVHVNGNLAWEMGQETGEQKMKDGRSPKLDYLVTNVYEKIDGKWLMVSHHVQPKPQ